MQTLGTDFVAVSGHKMCGPSGIGFLWGRSEILQAMEPFLMGGHMIRKVTDEATTWGELPAKFEAGTSPMAEAVGLGAAIDYLEAAGLDAIEQHEHALAGYALEQLGDIAGITLYGPPADRRAGIVSFNLDAGVRLHPHDVAQFLDLDGVCIRAGHHCCQPLMRKLGVTATNRASFYLYNTVDVLGRVVEVEARAVRRRDAELAHQRLAAVVAGADRDAVEVEELRDVVRVRPAGVEVEADDPGAPVRRRAVQRHARDLAELLERVPGEGVLVGLDRLEPDGLEIVDGGAEPDGLRHRRGAGLELRAAARPRSSRGRRRGGSCGRPSGTAASPASSSARPQRKPIPLGPTILWPDTATKSAPRVCTSSRGAAPPARRRSRRSRRARAPTRPAASCR